MISVSDYPWLYLVLFASILACRVLPMFLLKGRTLPPRVEHAFSLIPVAAFAALVANDLLKPDVLPANPVQAALPVVAAVPVVVTARKTGSLIWSAVIGMAAYALLTYLL